MRDQEYNRREDPLVVVNLNKTKYHSIKNFFSLFYTKKAKEMVNIDENDDRYNNQKN